MGEVRMVDMHCHVSLMANGAEVARDAAARGIALFDVPVTPAGTMAARELFAGDNSPCPNCHVRVGVGLHPWQLADGTCDARDIDQAILLAAPSPFVGEVGLDFSPRFQESFALQREAFDMIARACAERPVSGRVMSIHAVHAAGEVLDILERYDLPRHTACIFHWFSGTGDDLTRARKLGCFFSVNERMLASRRGRAYAQQMPAERLLLETDAPPQLGEPYTAQALEDSLNRTLDMLAAVRAEDREELARLLAATACDLLKV